jgi:hypothetical protein
VAIAPDEGPSLALCVIITLTLTFRGVVYINTFEVPARPINICLCHSMAWKHGPESEDECYNMILHGALLLSITRVTEITEI